MVLDKTEMAQADKEYKQRLRDRRFIIESQDTNNVKPDSVTYMNAVTELRDLFSKENADAVMKEKPSYAILKALLENVQKQKGGKRIIHYNGV